MMKDKNFSQPNKELKKVWKFPWMFKVSTDSLNNKNGIRQNNLKFKTHKRDMYQVIKSYNNL